MTYQEYITQVKVSGYLGRPLTGRFKEIHDFLTGLWDGMECVVSVRGRWGDRIIFHKGGQWYFDRDLKDGFMWCVGDLVWSWFKDVPGMGYADVSAFMTGVLEDRLGCDVGRVAETSYDRMIRTVSTVDVPRS